MSNTPMYWPRGKFFSEPTAFFTKLEDAMRAITEFETGIVKLADPDFANATFVNTEFAILPKDGGFYLRVIPSYDNDASLRYVAKEFGGAVKLIEARPFD